MITKNKKSSMSMLRKMSIIPVALVAMYLFACHAGSQSEADSEIVTFDLVTEKPLFNGMSADEGFREWVASNTNYPPVAQEHGITGRIFVEFVIEKDGSVSNVKILRGVDPLLDNEALRVINASPNWTPGKQGRKKVRVKYTFPFYFQLSEQTPAMATTNAEAKTVSGGDEEIFLFALVGEKPLFNNMDAEKGFRDYVYSKTVYPQEAQENGVTGRVYVDFIIDTDGSVTNVKLMHGADPLLDAEALRVISSSPKWTPGKHDGKEVKVKYVFPFYFQLNN